MWGVHAFSGHERIVQVHPLRVEPGVEVEDVTQQECPAFFTSLGEVCSHAELNEQHQLIRSVEPMSAQNL